MFRDLILKNRSYRRFYENEKIPMDTLKELVDLARLSPNGANRQGLRFFLSDGAMNDAILSCLGWAGYLTDWDGPEPGERPAAYIVILNDKFIGGGEADVGIAATSILLGAVELGYGGCMFGAVNRQKLSGILKLPENITVSLVIALGKPKETVVLDTVKDDDIKYWRDENRVHHVPKRKLEDILYNMP